MISETDLLWWCSLNECHALREIKSVCDLGLQEITAHHRKVFDAAAQRFAALCGEPDADLLDCRSSADMWRRLKRKIVSLDLVGSDPSLISFDLNKDQVPRKLRNRFDLVTNVGTTEHVFNQLNCFKVLHDLTKVRGIMAHAVPCAGFESHGMFKYPLKFFWALARDNGYDCLDAWTSLDSEHRVSKTNVAQFLRDDANLFRNARSDEQHPVKFYGLNFDDYRTADGGLYVFLRKTSSAPFQIPMDLAA